MTVAWLALSISIASLAASAVIAFSTWENRQAELSFEPTPNMTWVLRNDGNRPAYNIQIECSTTLTLAPANSAGHPGAFVRGDRAWPYGRLDPRGSADFVVMRRLSQPGSGFHVQISWTRRESGGRRWTLRTDPPQHSLLTMSPENDPDAQ